MSFLRRFGSWLNRKLNIIATEEESRWYSEADRILDRRDKP